MTTRKFPRLHIFLGAGGVGKTTLSAGYAISLAEKGRKVGLLSIDPAKRLQGALGVGTLTDEGTVISVGKNNGEVRAALLHVGQSLRRWVTQQGMSTESRDKLFDHVLFRAVADKFATSSDTLAAARMAEWAETFPDTDDLVIDTAPGIHAIDFLAKPEKLMDFFDSKLIEWLKWFVGDANTKTNVWQKVVKSGARKILDGLAQIGGQTFLYSMGELVVLLDDVFITMLRRLELAQSWLSHPDTELVLVTSVREDAASVSQSLGETLRSMGLRPGMTVINRAFPATLAKDPGLGDFLASNPKQSAEASFQNYVKSFLRTQRIVEDRMRSFSKRVILLPIMSQLEDKDELRMEDLSLLGSLIGQGAR